MINLLLVAAAFGAGLMNSVAGGGSFLSFPALIFAGIPSVMANATSTVAVFPGTLASAWAYRSDFPRLDGVNTWLMLAVSLTGGVAGALLLIWTPVRTFDALVPWLLLAATILFTFGKRLTPYLQRRFTIGAGTLYCVQFLIAVYGGYFGGAIGIMMLALYGLFGLTDINSMNALKTLMGGMLNAIAVVCFIAADQIVWKPAVMMLVACVAGGYVGARVARRMNPGHVRAVIIAIGVTMTVAFFARS